MIKDGREFWQKYSGADWPCCMRDGCLMPALYFVELDPIHDDDPVAELCCSKCAGDPEDGSFFEAVDPQREAA